MSSTEHDQQTTLRTGAVVPSVLIDVIGLTLDDLFSSDPIAFYELVQLCRNPGHEIFFGQKRLTELNLIGVNGQPHDATRDIVLASVEGDELSLRLVDPRS